MTMTPRQMADRLREGLTPMLKKTISELESHYADLRQRELRKAIPQPQQPPAAPASASSPHETALEELKLTHGISPESVAKIHGFGDNGYEYAIHGQTKDGRHFLVHQNYEDGMWSYPSPPEFFSSPKEMQASQSWSDAKNTLVNHSRLGGPGLQKAEACQKCGDMHRPLEKCGDMTAGKVKKEEPKMNPAPLKSRKTVADQKAAPDAADPDSVLPTDKKSKDLTDKDTGAGGQLEKIRKAAWSETAKKAEKLAKPGSHTEKEKRQAAHIKESYKDKGRSEKEAESLAWATVNKGELKKSGMPSVPMAKPKAATAAPASSGSPPKLSKDAVPMSRVKIPGRPSSMSPEDHARALATQGAFTPKAVAEEPEAQGAAGGELKRPKPKLPLPPSSSTKGLDG